MQKNKTLADELAELDRLDDESATPGGGEHLATERGRLATGILNLQQVGLGRRVSRHLASGQTGVAEDPGKQVVEFMSDAPGQNTETFQAKGSLHATLQGAASSSARRLGNFPGDAAHPLDLAVGRIELFT